DFHVTGVQTCALPISSLEALALAVKKLQPTPDHVLVDALKIDIAHKQTKIIHGDALSCSIAAASIIAKVERDRWMRDFDAEYPQIGRASCRERVVSSG